jgi:DNA-binding beta-propeller fold protein YncE
MKLRKIFGCMAIIALASFGFSGCGGSAVTVGVTLSQSSAVLVPTQVLDLTATVTGTTSTNLNVNWTCTYTVTTTTTNSGGSTSTSTSSAKTCDSTTGVLSNIQGTSVTFTAPSQISVPPATATTTTAPPVVTITAAAQVNTNKKATCIVDLNSGISVTVVPSAAYVPTSQNFQFTAGLTNDSTPNDVTWRLTQEPVTTPDLQTADTCSPNCGTISSTGLYTAPATVPTAATPSSITSTTPATALVVAISNLDNTRIGVAVVTIVPAGPITFTAITPTSAPQGGVLEDVYLAAANVNSLTSIFFDGVAEPTSQVQVVASVQAGAAPSGARIRLTQQQLSVGGSHTISMCNPSTGQDTCAPNSTGGPFTLTVVPTRPILLATNPASLPQSTGVSGGNINIDGGYFGAPGNPLVSAQFNGNPIAVTAPGARQITLTTPSLSTPGLFPVSVTNGNASPSTAVTNLAVFPDYSNSAPAPPVSSFINLASGTGGAPATPDAIALDDVYDVAIVAEAGTNSVEYINLNGGTPALIPGRVPVGNAPTGVAVDDQLHIAAVINYSDRTMWLLQVPAPGQTPSTTPIAQINLGSLIPTTAPTTPPTPPPFPYSVGIDPFSHRALIAFASTNVGFVADINPANSANTSECLQAGQAPPCVVSSVTLNSGQYPQIAFEPHIHLAYVTPGGAGTLSVVDLTNPSQPPVGIATATRSANVVQITTVAPHNLNPGNPGTVVIAGVPTTNTNFNGSFTVTSIIDAYDFTYSQTLPNDTQSGGTASNPIGEMSAGTAFLTFNISPTDQGIAVNPISRTAMIADPNATTSQIDFINTLDQAVSSMTLTAGSIGSNTTNAVEIRDTNVAFQPYSNTAVLFNPQRNEISLIDPTRLQRFQIIPSGGTGLGSVSVPSGTSTPNSLPLTGALLVDPATNLALAVNSGSNNISVLSLGAIKPVHINQVLLTSGGIPGALFPQATLTTNSTPNPGGPVNIRILGTGFNGGSAVVRLDGTPLSSVNVVSNVEIDATIPTSFLTLPRHYALDVIVNGVGSNATDFTVVQTIDLTPSCGSGSSPLPGGVAIDTLRNIAVVTNSGCSSISLIDLTPGSAAPLKSTISVGPNPLGVDVIPRMGYAVVANNGSGTASIVNLDAGTVVASPGTGTSPRGVAINQFSGAALVANTGSNSVSLIDLTSITSSSSTPTVTTVGVDQNPIAIAIDPNRAGCYTSSTTSTSSSTTTTIPSGVGIAVVTALQLSTSSSPTGVLDVVDISTSTPQKCVSNTGSGLTATPTDVVIDPSVTPAVFYATSSQGNTIYTFNPNNPTAIVPANVGINPTSLALNYQTGTIITVNSLSNTISVIDSQTMKTRETISIPTALNPSTANAQSTTTAPTQQFAAAIHPLTNMAIITDQINNRVLILPLPN